MDGVYLREIDPEKKIHITIDAESFSLAKDFEQEITFEQEYVDVFGASYANEIGSFVVLFLMEDGTVQYIALGNNLVGPDYNKELELKKISGVEDIINFRSATYSDGKEGQITIIAQKADGTFYDLRDFLY